MISVIVPVYNRENKIRRCVDSIRKQTYQDLEIILVDDGSKDDSLQVCRQMHEEDSRIKVLHQENAGVSAARNYGMANATGEYIAFVDSDDMIPENYYASMIEVADKYGKQYHIMTGAELSTENGVESVRCYQDEELSFVVMKEIPTLLRTLLVHSIWNALFRSEVIRAAKLEFKVGMNFGEDFLFHVQYLRNATEDGVVVLNRVYYQYCLEVGESLTQKYHPQYFEYNQWTYEAVEKLCRQACVTRDGWRIVEEMYWGTCNLALKQTMDKNNIPSLIARVRRTREILCNESVQKVISVRKEKYNKFSYWCYRKKWYLPIYIKDQMMKKDKSSWR